MLDFFVQRSQATLLSIVLLILLGMQAYHKIAKESTPDVKIPIVYIVVTQQGISPEDAERMIIRPLESALKSIDGIKDMNSYAYEGSAVIFLEFVAGLDSNVVVTNVRNKVQDTKNKLPYEADEPVIREINLSLFPVLSIVLTSDMPDRQLLTIARDLKKQLESVPGVLQADLVGNVEDALNIIIEPHILEGYQLPIDVISKIVNANNLLLATGSARTVGADIPVKMPSLIKTPADLLHFPIGAHADKILYLRDVATVQMGYKDVTSIAKANNRSALIINVVKKTGENVIKTVAAVKAKVDAERKIKQWPEKLHIDYAQDKSHDIIEMIVDLENSIIIATALVILVVMLSVGINSALLISLSIPVSFFSGILLLQYMGLSLNVVVLFSLILTVGMIVDDAIVVSEYADRLLAQGVPANQAFLQAAKRMFWPIVTSTLVKIIVFMPLLFWPGVVGQFMFYMPLTVIAILSSSLLFALCFQPALGPYFQKQHHNTHTDSNLLLVEKGQLHKLTGGLAWYHQSLQSILATPAKFSKKIAGIMVVVWIGFIVCGPGFEFFPKVEPTSAMLSVQTPGNLSIEDKLQVMQQVDEVLNRYTQYFNLFYSEAGNYSRDQQKVADTIVIASLEFSDWRHRPKVKEITTTLSQELHNIPGIKFEFVENKEGPPAQKPIQINIAGYVLEDIEQAADNLLEYMRQDQDFIEIEDSRSNSKWEWQLLPNRQEAARFGIAINDIGSFVSLATEGKKISSCRIDGIEDEVDIMLRFPNEYRQIKNVLDLKLMNTQKQAIPLDALLENKISKSVSSIKRNNQNLVVSIKANIKNGVNTDAKVRQLKTWGYAQAWENVMVQFKGEDADMQETGAFLSNAFLLTLCMMFMIMLMQFNNLYHTIVVMSAVFLSTIGVLLGLLITYQPFGVVMCGIAIIALGGIVLNNNILLIDTYQYLLAQGVKQDDAIIQAALQRIRPILLTAITAILGLLPMVFGLTINIIDREITLDSPASQWWRQLSASIAGGLAFATILTLFFTPCLLKLRREKL